VSRGPGRAVRLARLRERLRGGPVGVADLAQELAVTRRTVERDLVTLRDHLGHAVEVDDRHRYRIKDGPSALNDVEALAVYSAARLLAHTGVGERHYRSAMTKLARQLPEPARGVLLQRIDRLRPAPDDRVLDQVAQAWFQRRVLRCRYRSAGRDEASWRDLEVYFFELNRRNLEPYVLAFDRSERQQVLVFKLARMRDVTLLNARYEVPPGFDPEAALRGSFGIVVGEGVAVDLRVSPVAARRLQERADPALELLEGEAAGGWRRARLHGTLDTEGRALELVPWLLGWGGEVEVMGPADVRREVAAALRRAAAHYEGVE
jgi:predicted DNA-binding transcriptional regulator YafY